MIKKWFTHNLGFKAIALILAIITWFYVNGELNKAKVYQRHAPTWYQH